MSFWLALRMSNIQYAGTRRMESNKIAILSMLVKALQKGDEENERQSAQQEETSSVSSCI